MKLEVIGEGTLLIELAASDLEENGFKIDDFKKYNPKVGQYVRSVVGKQSLLDLNIESPLSIGVLLYDSSVFIQVTEINNENSKNEIKNNYENEEYTKNYLGYEVMCFTTFDNLLMATSRVLIKYKRISKSKLFIYEDKYYLTINTLAVTDRTRDRMDNIFSILEEFADYDDFTEEFLGEHGKCLIDKSAISTIGKLA